MVADGQSRKRPLALLLPSLGRARVGRRATARRHLLTFLASTHLAADGGSGVQWVSVLVGGVLVVVIVGSRSTMNFFLEDGLGLGDLELGLEGAGGGTGIDGGIGATARIGKINGLVGDFLGWAAPEEG